MWLARSSARAWAARGATSSSNDDGEARGRASRLVHRRAAPIGIGIGIGAGAVVGVVVGVVAADEPRGRLIDVPP